MTPKQNENRDQDQDDASLYSHFSQTPQDVSNDALCNHKRSSSDSPDHIVMNRGRSSTNDSIEYTAMRGICNKGPSCIMTSTSAYYGEPIGLALDTIVVLPFELQEGQEEEPTSSSSCQENMNGIVASSEFLVRFPSQSLNNKNGDDKNYRVIIQINGNNLDESFLSMALPKNGKGKKNATGVGMCNFIQGNSTKPSTDVLDQLVKQKILIPGRNLLRYILVRKNKTKSKIAADLETSATTPQSTDVVLTGGKSLDCETTPIGHAEAYCFVWSVHDKIIISDIDGTVTKSDVRGVIDSIVTEKYGHVHDGICELFTELVQYEKNYGNDDNNNHCEKKECDPSASSLSAYASSRQRGQIRVLYLSSRPMKLINTTRKFLSLVSQLQANKDVDESNTPMLPRSRFYIPCINPNVEDGVISSGSFTALSQSVGLPPGPIFLNTATLSTVLMTEIIKKTTHEFKADLLARQVVLPFVAAGKKSSRSRLFVAGFGNKRTDLMAYEMAGVSSQDIYIINTKSELVSTMKTLEHDEGDSMDVPVAMNCCNVLETISSMNNANEGFISEKVISVTNPDKISNSSSNRKRIFQGYQDPLLRQELLQRLRSH